jgi:hypothetical protein
MRVKDAPVLARAGGASVSKNPSTTAIHRLSPVRLGWPGGERRIIRTDASVHVFERLPNRRSVCQTTFGADGSIWVARVSPADRSIEAAGGDAALLDWLVEAGIPAERTAAPDPVSTHAGQAVLVTEFAPGRRPAASPTLFSQVEL